MVSVYKILLDFRRCDKIVFVLEKWELACHSSASNSLTHFLTCKSWSVYTPNKAAHGITTPGHDCIVFTKFNYILWHLQWILSKTRMWNGIISFNGNAPPSHFSIFSSIQMLRRWMIVFGIVSTCFWEGGIVNLVKGQNYWENSITSIIRSWIWLVLLVLVWLAICEATLVESLCTTQMQNITTIFWAKVNSEQWNLRSITTSSYKHWGVSNYCWTDRSGKRQRNVYPQVTGPFRCIHNQWMQPVDASHRARDVESVS